MEEPAADVLRKLCSEGPDALTDAERAEARAALERVMADHPAYQPDRRRTSSPRDRVVAGLNGAAADLTMFPPELVSVVVAERLVRMAREIEQWGARDLLGTVQR